MRVHVFFPLLAIVCLGLSGSDGIWRGLGLFLVVVAAVAVRDTVRLMVAAWLGLQLRAILLLPIGGLFAYANPESQDRSNQGNGQFAMALAGPLANLATALALAAMLGGMWLHSPWLIVAGFFIMIGAQIEDQGVFFQTVVDTVHMREVMLTDFATLSSSDTLADALVRCVHSLQEDFPVVRGANLVGIISRQRIVDALRNDGNGYVQGVMSKAFQVAQPEDTLGTTIRRLQTGHGLSLIPVTDSGRVVGIVSVQNLMSSMSLLAEQRRLERDQARS